MARILKPLLIPGLILTAALLVWGWTTWRSPAPWTGEESALIASLHLDALAPLPPDPSNRVADNPLAADMGQALFFDPRLSGNGQVSCAFCHRPERDFTDGMPKARALGQSRRNTPSITGTAYSPWQYWDGRRDSQWAQALSPMEDPAEQGGNRMAIVRLVTGDPAYRDRYRTLFGEPPDFSEPSRFPRDASPLVAGGMASAWAGMAPMDQTLVNQAFANLGKTIAAYERLLLPGPARFDAYAVALADGDATGGGYFDKDEIRGLRLFIGEGRCLECHNGPLFTNNEFHNTGILSYPGDLPDRGRIDGVRDVLTNPFNCRGAYSDAGPDECPELTYVRQGPELIGAFRTPSLRNLRDTAPYMHKGQLKTLAEVLDHYNRAPLAMIGHNEAETPLGLSARQLRQLEAFLDTLASPIAVPAYRLRPPD